jgi:hypothetical protein
MKNTFMPIYQRLFNFYLVVVCEIRPVTRGLWPRFSFPLDGLVLLHQFLSNMKW